MCTDSVDPLFACPHSCRDVTQPTRVRGRHACAESFSRPLGRVVHHWPARCSRFSLNFCFSLGLLVRPAVEVEVAQCMLRLCRLLVRSMSCLIFITKSFGGLARGLSSPCHALYGVPPSSDLDGSVSGECNDIPQYPNVCGPIFS